MGNGFLENFKRAVAGDDTQHYAVADIQVKCPHCGGIDFELASALLNTPGMTFMNLDWANRDGAIMSCVHCSHTMWFLKDPERI